MRTKLLVWCLCWLVAAVHAQALPDRPKFDFRGINVAQAVQLIYAEAVKGGYVIDPEVLTDNRAVSFRYDGSQGELSSFIAAFFDSIGLTVTRRNNVDYIKKKQVVQKDDEELERDVFVYRPRHRDGSYLVDLLTPVLHGAFTAKKTLHPAVGDKQPQQAVPSSSAAALIDRKSDTLVFSGTAVEIDRLKKLLPQVDVPVGDVMVRGVLYEVQTARNDGSAFGLALNLLGGKLTAGLGGPVGAVGDFVRLKNHSIDAVLSSLSGDSRFTVRSTPSLRVSSGGTGRFTVGQDVPVLGAVTYSGNNNVPIRSVEYRSSGVIFDLQPILHDGGIELTVMQQVSNFVATNTGVNDSPTLIKRELKTNLALSDGELVVIGGLAETKESGSRDGPAFLPSFFHSKTSDQSSTEILLVLQVTKI